jgi:hypothetical protein
MHIVRINSNAQQIKWFFYPSCGFYYQLISASYKEPHLEVSMFDLKQHKLFLNDIQTANPIIDSIII